MFSNEKENCDLQLFQLVAYNIDPQNVPNSKVTGLETE